jgi:4-hydroxy-tetrahydrodipicolinate synthase
VGGVGVVGTSTHFTGALTKQLIEAFEAGDTAQALRLHRRLLPVYTGIFRTQGVIMVKAGLTLQGRSAGGVRLPMVDATEHEISHLRLDLAAAGLL